MLMAVDVESRSNLEIFSERELSVPRDGLNMGSEGEGSDTPYSGWLIISFHEPVRGWARET